MRTWSLIKLNFMRIRQKWFKSIQYTLNSEADLPDTVPLLQVSLSIYAKA